MNEIIVAYWSQTGNTEAMANAVGEGIEAAGKKALVTEISGVSMDDLKNASVFAMGCPAMGAEVLEEAEELALGSSLVEEIAVFSLATV